MALTASLPSGLNKVISKLTFYTIRLIIMTNNFNIVNSLTLSLLCVHFYSFIPCAVFRVWASE